MNRFLKTNVWFCLVCLFVLAGGHAQGQIKYRVLAIHSYHKGFTWTDSIDAALRDVFAKHPDIEITSEFLDSKRWPLDKVQNSFLYHLQAKFSDAPPDAIIISDNNALTFLQKFYTNYFKGIPVVFCGINNFQPEVVKGFGDKITGVLERTDTAGTISLIKRIQPDLQSLVIITGASPTAQIIKKETEIQLEKFKNDFEIIWKDRLASKELFSFLKGLSSKEAVLLIAFNRDKEGTYYSYEQSAKLISSQSAVPVYGLWDFYMNTGIVGGKMVYSKDQGKTAAKLCLSILQKGNIPPIIKNSPNATLIDYPSFAAHELKEENLPVETIVFNKPISFYAANKILIWSVLSFITVLITLIFILTVNIIRRKESEKKYRSLFEDSMDAILLIDYDVKILDCNPATLKLFKVSSKEKFVMLDPVALSPTYQTDGTLSTRKRDEITKRTQEQGLHIFEWRYRKMDGHEFDASVLLSQVEINGKTVLQATVRDISEQKLAEKERDNIEKKLHQAQKMEAIGTLAGGIAHDFNNILGAIMGYTQLARLDSDENPKVAGYLDQLSIASERARQLVQQILSFSRQTELEKTPVDIGIVIKEAIKLLRASIPSTIEIRQNVKSNLGIVKADQTQIHQIVMNLCTNAFHAMKENGGRIEVELSPVKISMEEAHSYPGITSGEYLKLTVTDNGHGMDSATILRIFEPYFTTKESGDGTGLGLSTVHGIVKSHGGSINVYSDVGEGTSIQVLFPTISGMKKNDADVETVLPRGTEPILFVDDEKPLADIGRELLEGLGYRVEIRTNSYAALEAIRARPDDYDMVITDLTMPKMDGISLASQIKEIRPDISIIMCTGYSTNITTDNIEKAGINGVLMKPLALHDIAKTVRDVLDKLK